MLFSLDSQVVLLFYLLSLAAASSKATPFFLDESDLVSASPNCAAALTAELDCPSEIIYSPERFYPSLPLLERMCTPTCKRSIDEYHRSIAANCADSWTWTLRPQVGTAEVPVIHNATFFGDLAVYNRDMHCERASNGDFCVPLFTAAREGNGTALECDECMVGRLRTQMNSPVGVDESRRDVYAMLAETCKLDPKKYPVPPAVTRNTTTITPEQRFKNIHGAFLAIQQNENCEQFSIRANVSTNELLRVNKLAAGCTNWPSGKLFIPEAAKCKAYVVADDDECLGITRRFGLRLSEFLSWNPEIDAKCRNLLVHKQTTVCVSQPGGEYTIPDAAWEKPPQPSAPAVVKRGVLAEGTKKCARFHRYVGRESCTALMMRYAITHADFLFLNPSVEVNCGNLAEGHNYCVEPVGPYVDYEGHDLAVKAARKKRRLPVVPFAELRKRATQRVGKAGR